METTSSETQVCVCIEERNRVSYYILISLFLSSLCSNVYNHSYHTLCQVPSPNATDVIFIDTFTSSKTTVSYGAKIEPIDDFVLE